MNDPIGYIKSRHFDQLVCRHLLPAEAKLASRRNDFDGTDIICGREKIDTKYQLNKGSDDFVWFAVGRQCKDGERVKFKSGSSCSLKTDRFMVFFYASLEKLEWIDTYAIEILDVLERGLAERDSSICCESVSKNAKHDENGHVYYDILCWAKLSWLRDACPEAFKICTDKKTAESFVKVQRYFNEKIDSSPKTVDKFIECISSFVDNGQTLDIALENVLMKMDGLADL